MPHSTADQRLLHILLTGVKQVISSQLFILVTQQESLQHCLTREAEAFQL